VGQCESDASSTVCATAAAFLSLFDSNAEDKSFMQEPDLFFVIPTYRLREVGETVELYDEHFWRNGQSVRMIKASLSSLDELSIAFDYEGEVTAQVWY